MRVTLPLVGLQEDGVLPGEERTLGAAMLGKARLTALAALVDTVEEAFAAAFGT